MPQRAIQQIVIEQIITKELKPLSDLGSKERLFKGILTAEVVDKQNEIVVVDELEKVLPLWMNSGASISDTHSNRIIGRGLNYQRVDIKNGDRLVPAIEITGVVYNRGYALDDLIWKAVVEGRYKGLSFGGSTKSDRMPVQLTDGKFGYKLADLEMYEVALCENPANAMALITDYNRLAKAMPAEALSGMNMITINRANEVMITCNKMTCYVEKEFVIKDGKVEEEKPKDKKPDGDKKDSKDTKQVTVNPNQSIEVHVPEVSADEIYADRKPEGEAVEIKSPKDQANFNNEGSSADSNNMSSPSVATEDQQHKVVPSEDKEKPKDKKEEVNEKEKSAGDIIDQIGKVFDSKLSGMQQSIEKNLNARLDKMFEQKAEQMKKDQFAMEAKPNSEVKLPSAPYDNSDTDLENSERDKLRLEKVSKSSLRTPVGQSGNTPAGEAMSDGFIIKMMRDGEKTPTQMAQIINSGEIFNVMKTEKPDLRRMV